MYGMNFFSFWKDHLRLKSQNNQVTSWQKENIIDCNPFCILGFYILNYQINCRDSTQYTRIYFLQRSGQYCCNAASKSPSVYTNVPSPGKECTFQWGQIQLPRPPNASFIFICFHVQLAFHDLYNIHVFCLFKIELQNSKTKAVI